jgi:hypothetical protein
MDEMSGNARFICSIWTGAVLDIVESSGGFMSSTGGFMVVNSITDDDKNIYLGVSVESSNGVPDGTVLITLSMISYRGNGNVNGDSGGFTSSDQGDRKLPGFPNGDIKSAVGNKRSVLIAPQSGSSYLNDLQVCRGRLKSISVNVLRAYTGSQFRANALALTIAEERPVQDEFLTQINLSHIGQRRLTPSAVTGAKTKDVLKPSSAFMSAFRVQIAPFSGKPTKLTDKTSALPIIKLDIELDPIPSSF